MNPFTKYIGESVYTRGEYQETVIGVHGNKCLVLCMTGSNFELYRLEVMDEKQNLLSNHAYYTTFDAFTALLQQ